MFIHQSQAEKRTRGTAEILGL